MEQIFAQYYEDLLRAQYRVSEALVKDRHLSCGTIREEFLREILLKKRPSIGITKGFVRKEGNLSGECDLIFHHKDSSTDTIGGQLFIKPEYCRLVLEVKSNATGNDIKKTNANYEKIKAIDSDFQPRCGLFCYNTKLKKKTVLNRFGWNFDTDLESWEADENIRLEYPYIDFIINIACLEEGEECMENQFFLLRDMESGRFELSLEYPIITNFFTVTDNL